MLRFQAWPIDCMGKNRYSLREQTASRGWQTCNFHYTARINPQRRRSSRCGKKLETTSTCRCRVRRNNWSTKLNLNQKAFSCKINAYSKCWITGGKCRVSIISKDLIKTPWKRLSICRWIHHLTNYPPSNNHFRHQCTRSESLRSAS